MCSFSLGLLWHLFCTSPGSSMKSLCMTLYNHLPVQILNVIKSSLHSLLHEQIDMVHQKAVNMICNLTNNSMERSRPWHALQAQAFAMCKGADLTARDSTFCIFASCPNLVMDLQTDAVLRVLQDGLQGQQSINVCAFIFLLPKSRCSFNIFVGPAHSFVGFDILSHALHSASSHIVLIAHVPDAWYLPPLVSHAHIPKFLINLTPHTKSHDVPPTTICPAYAHLAHLPPCRDHTIHRFRTNTDSREALAHRVLYSHQHQMGGLSKTRNLTKRLRKCAKPHLSSWPASARPSLPWSATPAAGWAPSCTDV